jgi:hypothetical protein
MPTQLVCSIMASPTISSGQASFFGRVCPGRLLKPLGSCSSQIEWFVQTSESAQPILRPYSPPAVIDNTFGIDGRQVDPPRALKRQNAYVRVSFFVFIRA